MKKLLFIFFALMSVTITFAQEIVTEPTNTTDTTHVWCEKGKFYKGTELLSKEAYEHLLFYTCPEAFTQYDKSVTYQKTGWGLFGAGAGLVFVVGIPTYFWGGFMPMPDIEGTIAMTPGDPIIASAFVGAGAALLIASIPVLCVGYSYRDKSINTYNQQCGHKEPAITYNLTAGQNGIGLAINF